MVAIDALKSSGKQLELGCFACHLHVYVDPALIAVLGDTRAKLQRTRSLLANRSGSRMMSELAP